MNPFSHRLHLKKLMGKGNYYRYEVGKKIRILVEIQIQENKLEFLRIGRRENFY